MVTDKRNILEQHLKEQNNQNSILIDFNPDAIFALDIKGHFVQMNKACEQMMGYPSKALKNLSFTDLFQADRDKVQDRFQKSLRGEFQNYDSSFQNSNRETVYVNITTIPISVHNEIIGAYGIAKDITEIKNKQKLLNRNQELYRFLTEHSIEMITKTDASGDFTYVSPACVKVLGYQPEELIGKFSGDFIHKDDYKSSGLTHQELFTNKKPNTLLLRMKHKAGHYIWIEALSNPMINHKSGHVEEVVSVIRDINERIIKEETYKRIIEQSPDAIFIANDDGFLFMNDQCLELLNAKSMDEIVERGPFSFILPEHMESIQQRAKQVDNGEIADFMEMKIRTFTGQIKDVVAKVIPTLYQNKPARHIIMRDITQRKQTQELLLNSEKLSVAGQLAAGIAHEVRNPLTSIRGFIQLLEKLSNGKKEYFDIIYTEIDRINLILTELLTLAKPQDTQFETYDLQAMLEQVQILLGTQATLNNITIEILVDNNQPIMISGDENQLKQVFINFIKNSIEAMPHGGVISVKVNERGGHVAITFIDQGNGIPRDILSRIGQPFFTTKENGTGLGLMISKQIIENHNGTFKIESVEGKGTKIEVILPKVKSGSR